MGKIPFVRHAPPPSLINPSLNRLTHSGGCGVLNLRAVVCEFREIPSGDFTNLLVLRDACSFCTVLLVFTLLTQRRAEKLTVNTPLCRHKKSLDTSALRPAPGWFQSWIIIPLPFIL